MEAIRGKIYKDKLIKKDDQLRVLVDRPQCLYVVSKINNLCENLYETD